MEGWLSRKKNNIIFHPKVLGFTDYASGPADGAIGVKGGRGIPVLLKAKHPQLILHPRLAKKYVFDPSNVQRIHVFLLILKISAKDYFRPLHKVPIMPVA